MITYPIFLEFVKENILSYMPKEYEDCSIEVIRTIKENGKTVEGLAIVKTGEGVQLAPAYFCEPFFDLYQKTQDIEEVMQYMADMYVYWDKEGEKKRFPNLDNFQEVKNLIGYSIVNERFNRQMLKDLAHQTTEDLTKVYRVFHFTEEGGMSAKVSNEMLSAWGISIPELDAIANENMPKLFPPLLESLEFLAKGIMQEIDGERIDNLINVSFSLGNKMYMLSNTALTRGASTIFYPGLLESIREKVNEDFYILPASTEEVYIVSKSQGEAKWFGELVRSANEAINAPNEVLSDCIYEYTKESGKIRKVPESVPQVEKKRGLER